MEQVRERRMKHVALAALLLTMGCGLIQSPTPTPTPTKAAITTPTLTPAAWGNAWGRALRLHTEGDFVTAIRSYDTALELIPQDESTLAIRAGINISRSEAYLMLEKGLLAYAAASEADRLLDKATDFEKADTFWKLMAGQAMVLSASSIMYVEPAPDAKQLLKVKTLLERGKGIANLPEWHFFLGEVNLRLGMPQEAAEEFMMFLSAPDLLVTFVSRPTMRERAQEGLGKARK